MNIVDVESVDKKLKIGNLDIPLTPAIGAAMATQPTSDYSVGVRPEHLSFASKGFAGEVVVVEALGSESFIHVRTSHQGVEHLLVVREDGQSTINRGDKVAVTITGPVHVFGSDGERLAD